MAQIKSSLTFMICKKPLNFPNDIGVIDFMILMMQFYVENEKCEVILKEIQKAQEKDIPDADRVSES